MQEKKQFKSVFLLKVPYCSHPDSLSVGDFRAKMTFRPLPSLALAVLCAFVEKYKTYDYNIKAVDLNIEAYTEPGIPVDISVYPSLLAKAIQDNNYDVLSLSVSFVFNVKWVNDAVKLSRKFHPDAKIIIGGGYSTLFPERCLEKHEIDDAIIGEGETTFLHILNRYNNHQDVEFEKKFPPGPYVSKIGEGKIHAIGGAHRFFNLANLPMPAWGHLNIDEYFKKSGDGTLPIEGSRGCPYRCSFCSTFLAWGSGVRYKPVDNLINEILELNKRHPNLKRLLFVDDNLSFSKDWIKDFLTRLINMKLPLKIDIINFSVKHLDEEIIKLLKEAGLDFFIIAVETGSPEMQRRINKNINLDKVREVVKIMKKYDLQIGISWMLGFPDETMEQINETLNFARELKVFHNQFFSVLPYPGTQLFKEAKEANLLLFSEDALDKFDYRQGGYLRSDQWNDKQLNDIIYDINIETNFLDNQYLETAEKREVFLDNLEKLLLTLPDHIIAHLVVGYIYNQKNSRQECEKHYNHAKELFKDKALSETFTKYLSWDNPVIKDFNQFVNKSPDLNGVKP